MNIYIKHFSLLLITNTYIIAQQNEEINPLTQNNHSIILESFILIVILITIIIYKQYNNKKINAKLSQKVEEEIQKSREKDQMLFEQSKFISMGEMMENIAHQWRQPLSQINSSVLIIDDTLYEHNFKNSIIEEKLLEIESLTKYMSNTIDDFKDFFDQDKKSLNISLRELIDKSVYIVQGTYKANNIELVKNIDDEYEWSGYPNELQQVIVVILNNAKDMFKLRNIFKPKVTISIEEDKENFHILVSDNAGGISENIIEKVFDPYFTTKHESQGTGLGLFLSKKIIEESMHGKLEVQNIKNGACFKIILKNG